MINAYSAVSYTAIDYRQIKYKIGSLELRLMVSLPSLKKEEKNVYPWRDSDAFLDNFNKGQKASLAGKSSFRKLPHVLSPWKWQFILMLDENCFSIIKLFILFICSKMLKIVLSKYHKILFQVSILTESIKNPSN